MPLSHIDVDAIRELETHWIDEELTGNWKRLLELCTDDVIWLPPNGSAVRGREEVKKWLEGPQAEIQSLKVANVQVEGEGSIAYKIAEYQTSYIQPGKKRATYATGTHLWVLRNEPHFGWRIAILAWNYTSPVKKPPFAAH